MDKIAALLFLLFVTSCSRNTFYIVRHAEKAAAAPNMSADVPLSAAGAERAQSLKEKLKDARITAIYATNTIRTKSTAGPLSELKNVAINTYDPKDTLFVPRLKQQAKGAQLIVGHSNTVDDLVNQFLGRKELSDLLDAAYGDLFIITKKGKGYRFSRDRFGK